MQTHGVSFDHEHKTRLAFVSLTASGERDFEFWEKSPADEQLKEQDLDTSFLAGAGIVHFAHSFC